MLQKGSVIGGDDANADDGQALISVYEDLSEGFSSAWPYVSFKGITNFQIIFNANKRDELVRLMLPEGALRVLRSYITETADLYLLTESEQTYDMYKIDLSKYTKKKKHQAAEDGAEFVSEQIFTTSR